MRELKFRIWDYQNKTWVKNEQFLHLSDNWSICPFSSKLVNFVGLWDGKQKTSYHKHCSLENEENSRFEIQQCTGLLDSSQQNCYEGDLITFKPKSNKPPFYQIKYDFDRACFLPYDIKKNVFLQNDEGFPAFLYSDEFRILGNVFENQDLLKYYEKM